MLAGCRPTTARSVGTTSWFQGNSTVFPAQSGAATSYIGANFNNTTGTNTISNWLLTPPVTLQNGETMTFWTRTVTAPAFPDRLQVRMSTNGSSSNVGTTATDVGDFTALLLDINPTYTTTGYPNVWTQFTVTVSGVPSPTLGRLAFRYFVENGGPTRSELRLHRDRHVPVQWAGLRNANSGNTDSNTNGDRDRHSHGDRHRDGGWNANAFSNMCATKPGFRRHYDLDWSWVGADEPQRSCRFNKLVPGE